MIHAITYVIKFSTLRVENNALHKNQVSISFHIWQQK
jgi:hypothetical protein